MRALGWNPAGAIEATERRAAQEVEQVARFNEDPAWRRGRIRDVIAAREWLVEINETLFRSFSERGAELEDVFSDVEETRRAFDSMPSFDVAVTLTWRICRWPQLLGGRRPQRPVRVSGLSSGL